MTHSSHLPPLVQLKLRCKELNFLLKQLQDSPEQEMRKPAGRHWASAWGSGGGRAGEEWLKQEMERQGFERLPNNRVVKRGEEGEKRV